MSRKLDQRDVENVQVLLGFYARLLRGEDVRTFTLTANGLLKTESREYGVTYSYRPYEVPGDRNSGPGSQIYTIYERPGAIRIFRVPVEDLGQSLVFAPGRTFLQKTPKGVLYLGELLRENKEPKLTKDIKPFLVALRLAVRLQERAESSTFGSVDTDPSDITYTEPPGDSTYQSIPTAPEGVVGAPPPPPSGPSPGARPGLVKGQDAYRLIAHLRSDQLDFNF